MIFSWRKKHRKIEWKPVVEGLEERAMLSHHGQLPNEFHPAPVVSHPVGSNPSSTPVPPMTPSPDVPVPPKKKPVIVGVNRRPVIRVPQPRTRRPVLMPIKGKKPKKIQPLKPHELPTDPDIKISGILIKMPVGVKK